MESKVTTTGINPRVSYSPQGKYARNGSAMEIVTLRSILDRCASGEFENKGKGASGGILPYVSTEFGKRPFVHEGVVILDLDKFNKEPGLIGKENKIYEMFDEIADKYMCNLLAMNFSYSHNLHIFVYDRNVVDAESYNRMQMIYTVYFAYVVKKILGIDLRDYEDALDDHQKAHQKLFVNHSPYKWNDYCTQMSISPKHLKILQSEYKSVFAKVADSREVKESTPIDGKGSVVVDKEYSILGWSGYRARTVIAAAAYFHFEKDITKAKEWLREKFSNANVIYTQMRSLVRNGNVTHWYNSDVEFVLFHNNEGKYILKDGEYLSDIIDFDTLNERYYYIQSNTNTGKTEFVKNLIKDRYTNVEGSEDLFNEKDRVPLPGNKVIILQMTKALRDGKKHGIESKTYNNWDDIVGVEQIHTTLEGFDRNIAGLKLDEYTVVVDESHLLEDYITIRRELTQRILRYLNRASKVIFMSATPKSDIRLFPFKKLVFEKIQKQILDVYQYPISMKGKGSVVATRYTHIINFVRELEKLGEKVLVFSNKKQIEWKKYGLEEGVTMFNSANINDDAVKEILENNRLINNITLATKYMGCGVEVKGEKKVHIVFLLDEGWNFDFIVQTLGRPRDAENISLHLFYSDYKQWQTGLTTKQRDALNNALDHLYAYTPDGILTVNILAAKMTGIYDTKYSECSEKERLNTLLIGNVLTESSIQTPYGVEMFKYLPYQTVNVHICDSIGLDTHNKRQQIREEKELIEYLCNCTEKELDELMGMEYEEIFQKVPYRDKSEARRAIRICKFIRNHRLNLKEVMSYFEKVSLAEKYVKALVIHSNIEAGYDAIESFEGSEKAGAELSADIERMKHIFTPEFVEGYITDIMRPGYLQKQTLKLTIDEVFKDVLISLGMWKSEYENIVYDFKDSYNDSKMFNTETYTISRKVVNSINGRKGGRTKQSISIEIIETKEVKTFGSKSECSEYMKSVGCSARQFNKLLKGEGEFADKYRVL